MEALWFQNSDHDFEELQKLDFEKKTISRTDMHRLEQKMLRVVHWMFSHSRLNFPGPKVKSIQKFLVLLFFKLSIFDEEIFILEAMCGID